MMNIDFICVPTIEDERERHARLRYKLLCRAAELEKEGEIREAWHAFMDAMWHEEMKRSME